MFVMHIIGSKTEFASLPADQSYLAPEKVNAPQSAHIKSLRRNHQEDCMGGGCLDMLEQPDSVEISGF